MLRDNTSTSFRGLHNIESHIRVTLVSQLNLLPFNDALVAHVSSEDAPCSVLATKIARRGLNDRVVRLEWYPLQVLSLDKVLSFHSILYLVTIFLLNPNKDETEWREFFKRNGFDVLQRHVAAIWGIFNIPRRVHEHT